VRRVDSERKGQVLQFLSESGLINRESADEQTQAEEKVQDPVVDLLGVDLSGADLRTVVALTGSIQGQTEASLTFEAMANLPGRVPTTVAESKELAEAYPETYGEAVRSTSEVVPGIQLRAAHLKGADLSGIVLNKADLLEGV
jgi:uncharacterized protein YjbI with pentapeptide repeats